MFRILFLFGDAVGYVVGSIVGAILKLLVSAIFNILTIAIKTAFRAMKRVTTRPDVPRSSPDNKITRSIVNARFVHVVGEDALVHPLSKTFSEMLRDKRNTKLELPPLPPEPEKPAPLELPPFDGKLWLLRDYQFIPIEAPTPAPKCTDVSLDALRKLYQQLQN